MDCIADYLIDLRQKYTQEIIGSMVKTEQGLDKDYVRTKPATSMNTGVFIDYNGMTLVVTC